MKEKIFTAQILCLSVVFLLFLPPSDAIMKGMSTEELTRASENVVVGEVEHAESQWSRDGKTIFTTSSVIVREVIRGEIKEQKLTVEYEGGEVGDIGLRVSDVAPLSKGEKVLLFLKSGKGKRDGTVQTIVGKGQGKYIIDESGIARKRGFSLAEGPERVENDIPLSVLIEKIKSVK
jgi:hypothetical protein